MTDDTAPVGPLTVAMTDPAHLKRWLTEKDLGFLVWNALDLVDSLPWPGGVETLQLLIAGYREHRGTIDTGIRERVALPRPTVLAGKVLSPFTATEMSVFKSEQLEPEEIDAAIAQLQRLRAGIEADRAKRNLNPTSNVED